MAEDARRAADEPPVQPVFTVRRFVADDEPAVLAIATGAGLTLDLEAERNKSFSELWVAEERASEPLGFALLWRIQQELELVDIATHALHLRRGIARQLLLFVLDRAREGGVEQAFLEVRASNGAALALYRGIGFEAAGIRSKYYSDGEDAVWMRHSFG